MRSTSPPSILQTRPRSCGRAKPNRLIVRPCSMQPMPSTRRFNRKVQHTIRNWPLPIRHARIRYRTRSSTSTIRWRQRISTIHPTWRRPMVTTHIVWPKPMPATTPIWHWRVSTTIAIKRRSMQLTTIRQAMRMRSIRRKYWMPILSSTIQSRPPIQNSPIRRRRQTTSTTPRCRMPMRNIAIR